MRTGYLRTLGVLTALAALGVFAGGASAGLIEVELAPSTHVEVTANACGHVDTATADGTDYAEAAAAATHSNHINPTPPPETFSHTADAWGMATVFLNGGVNIEARTALPDNDGNWPYHTFSHSGHAYGIFAVHIDPDEIYPEGTPLILNIQAPFGPKINPFGWSITTTWSVSLEGQEITEEWMELDVFSGDVLHGTFDLASSMSQTFPPSDIDPVSGGQVNMYLTPEPASVLLLAGGAVIVVLKRRRP